MAIMDLPKLFKCQGNFNPWFYSQRVMITEGIRHNWPIVHADSQRNFRAEEGRAHFPHAHPGKARVPVPPVTWVGSQGLKKLQPSLLAEISQQEHYTFMGGQRFDSD